MIEEMILKNIFITSTLFKYKKHNIVILSQN